MRLFTVLVFDQYVRGTVEVPSAPEHNETLGRAHDLVYEVEVEEASGTSVTLTVRHRHSNSGKGFLTGATPVNAASVDLGALPLRLIESASGRFGALGQATVQLGGTSPTARVRIWATGWSA